MINGITLKICGITSVDDAIAAAGIGADYLGFIFHPESPRQVSEARFRRMAAQLPPTRKVAVLVEADPARLERLLPFGFDAYQLHFRADAETTALTAWQQTVGRERLWLAPQLAPDAELHPEWLALADTFLCDTFHPGKFGGTGRTGNWPQFRRQAEAHPEKTWILAGGLTPDNLNAAIEATDALFVDVNSGVESAPGIKDPEKLFALWRALERLG
ncbi:MAG: phosphoribosylanthranilate isomerase [Akkermansiaceae bacterium]|jgi:phosphoribosylanthranilate isomerase|nr:phosphoribosylanthranilate isomerase [Akkermansiaceae bacterium]